jgi:hypothetical protein
MIWPFTKKIVQEEELPKLEELSFGAWRYTPAKDITPHEVALLLPMFIHPLWRVDYQGYVDKHNLRRHFTKIEE